MLRFGIVGLAGVDTRALARYIRDKGTGKALICDAAMPNIVGVAMLKTAAACRDQVSQVSTKIPWKSPAENARFHVVAVDCGIKHNIIRSLNRRGCDVTVVPWNISANELEALRPDGVFLSNGPGNPEDVTPVIELVRQLRGKYPIFGICLGHQIIALSYGAKTYKLKFGHRGGNHPVKNLLTGKVEITSQNHSYAVNAKSLDGTGLEVTHVNLLDNTLEGLWCEKDRVFSVQYHPESAPGPQDSSYLFDEFIRRMEECSHA
jgi:carbamoyl-phosphate synthase small subunit